MLAAKVDAQRVLRDRHPFVSVAERAPSPPLIERRIFREAVEFVATPAELAMVFSRHSITEGIGAETIASIGTRYTSGRLRDCLMEHAEDERKHARIFANLAERLPGGFQPDAALIAREKAENGQFLEHFNGNYIRFVCDTHVAEVRNLLFLTAYLDALADAKALQKLGLAPGIETVRCDEIRHVAYTGKFIDAWEDLGEPVSNYIAEACRVYDSALAEAA